MGLSPSKEEPYNWGNKQGGSQGMQRLNEIFANNLTVRHVVGFVLRMEGSELSPFFFLTTKWMVFFPPATHCE